METVETILNKLIENGSYEMVGIEYDVFNYWKNEPNDWVWFSDYYGYVKQKIRSGSEYSYDRTFWSEVI